MEAKGSSWEGRRHARERKNYATKSLPLRPLNCDATDDGQLPNKLHVVRSRLRTEALVRIRTLWHSVHHLSRIYIQSVIVGIVPNSSGKDRPRGGTRGIDRMRGGTRSIDRWTSRRRTGFQERDKNQMFAHSTQDMRLMLLRSRPFFIPQTECDQQKRRTIRFLWTVFLSMGETRPPRRNETLPPLNGLALSELS